MKKTSEVNPMAQDRLKNQENQTSMEPRGRESLSRGGSWPAFSPFGMMRRMSDDIDRIFQNFGFPTAQRMGSWNSQEQFLPQIDIAERNGKLIISADLPGMNKDDVKIDVSDNAIVIEGERKSEQEENKEGIYRSERSYGHFLRQIPLPEGVNTESANATFRNGVLEISLDAPKSSDNRRRIQIQSDESGENPGKSAA